MCAPINKICIRYKWLVMSSLTKEEKEKEFGDLLFQIMDVIEEFKDGNGNEGKYLEGMNAMKRLNELKRGLLETPVMHHFSVLLGRVQLPPKKRSIKEIEDKKQAGYVKCGTCGYYFANARCLRRHQSRNICRHIKAEKEVDELAGKFKNIDLKDLVHQLEIIHNEAQIVMLKFEGWEYPTRRVPAIVYKSIVRSGWLTIDCWVGRYRHRKPSGSSTIYTSFPPFPPRSNISTDHQMMFDIRVPFVSSDDMRLVP